ncbi:related to DHA14-like major facilitator efflux transporter (MFS transporter) [Fusarium fujikuroi IMI 58289]|uniref:Related to DHA14-like major facilitator efflux transporter (MFS transporter) n=1 Tax=Gibberella fujikuroi (strain CBS 195.34 / IMI 58289 / NRRL A-6831) TaxID=1279085 RepID=S0EL74_GIBF5|nr:related to DHA14-like major facilitator efflux transporter (MFS transporter) [Fusarium fujikuroi IMI 58289]CCT74652.1 related to DHA14-like major facilitator efflux transporter (MFS transporter) [Fusarium fujikuroi IMI 58289]SCO05232.1 related to DHA14-like major facilitator efflux transporter (MFS transporter) [Fusarium fujikuroi]
MTEPQQSQPSQDEQPNEKDSVGARLQPVETGASYEPPPMKTLQRRLVVLSLCLTLFLCALDTTILATALPTIGKELHVSAREYAWIGSSYTLSTTAVTPVWAKVSDIVGRKVSMMTSTGLFMAGSLICALASSSGMLIGGRTVQGLGGGGCMVLITILIGDLFPLKDRAKYYGITGIVFGVAGAIGPVLGGVFSQAVTWRWCFYINLPFEGIALIGLFFLLKVDIEKEPLVDGLRSLDWPGFAFIIGGTICFLYGLEAGSGGLAPWKSAFVICLLVFGVVILALFMVWEAKFAKNPIIPIRIFQSTTNIAAFAVANLHSFIFIACDYFLPLYFQVVLGFSPIISGVTLFPLILPMSISTGVGGLIVRKTGNYKLIILVGATLMTLGIGLFISLGQRKEWPKLVIAEVIAGLGCGVLFQNPMIALQTHVRQRDMAATMSAYTVMRGLFVSVSIVVGTVFIQRTVHGGNLTAVSSDKAQGETDKHGYVSGLRVMWAFYTALCGLMLVSAVFIKPKPVKAEEVSSEAASEAQQSDKC